VLPSLILAYEQALEYIEKQINDGEIKQKVITSIRYLCHPDPNLRGHKKNRDEIGSDYNLERFVSIFNHIASSLKYRAKRS
jgi:hypothetical protein